MADLFTLTQDASNPASQNNEGSFVVIGRRAGDTRLFIRSPTSPSLLNYVRRLAPAVWALTFDSFGQFEEDGFFCRKAGPYDDRFPPDGPYVGEGENPWTHTPYTGQLNGHGAYDPLSPLPWPSGPFWYPWCCDDSSFGCPWLSRCWIPQGLSFALDGITEKPSGTWPGTRCLQCNSLNGSYPLDYLTTAGSPNYTCYFGFLSYLHDEIDLNCSLSNLQVAIGPGSLPSEQVVALASINVGNVSLFWRKAFDHAPIDFMELNGVTFTPYKISYYLGGVYYTEVDWVFPIDPSVLYQLDTALSCRVEQATCVISL